MIRHKLRHGEIVHARVEEVYPTIDADSVTLCHVDGPYGLSKAAWDKVKDLAAWYRPHIAKWGRICAPSASVYLWNTAEGWAAIHPEMVAAGWTFAGLIVWDKRTGPSVISGQKASGWPNIIEVCGVYMRGAPPFTNAERMTNVWGVASTGYADEKYRHDTEMLKAAHGLEWAAPLHPCQKPLLFARRIVEASSRPGDLVFSPFGGTCREAVAIERMAAYDPASARRYIVVEQDEDGRDYIGAVLRQLGAIDPADCGPAGQVGLFAGGVR